MAEGASLWKGFWVSGCLVESVLDLGLWWGWGCVGFQVFTPKPQA